MTLDPEERLALTTALDLSLQDEVRSYALRNAVQQGINAINRGEAVVLDSETKIDEFLSHCLAEARRKVGEPAK